MIYRQTEVRGAMRIDWDIPVEMDDGVVLRADVLRPVGDGRHAVVLSHGPYAKWLHFADESPHHWERMSTEHPDTERGSTNTYQSWEASTRRNGFRTATPASGVDSRGAGRSPGYLSHETAVEIIDWGFGEAVTLGELRAAWGLEAAATKTNFHNLPDSGK